MIKNLLVFVIMILGTVACVSRVPSVAYNCSVIVLPADPVAPVTNLTSSSEPDDVMKAWVATATGYRDWNRIVRHQIIMSQKSV